MRNDSHHHLHGTKRTEQETVFSPNLLDRMFSAPVRPHVQAFGGATLLLLNMFLSFWGDNSRMDGRY